MIPNSLLVFIIVWFKELDEDIFLLLLLVSAYLKFESEYADDARTISLIFKSFDKAPAEPILIIFLTL